MPISLRRAEVLVESNTPVEQVPAPHPVPEKAISTGGAPPVVEDALVALKSIAEVGSLFLGLSFVGGWSFMASYYLAFGVSPSELDFGVPATSAFAVHMLRHAGWPLGLAAVLFLGLVIFNGKMGAARRAWAGVCTTVLLFAVATAGSMRGRTLAAEDMYETSPRLPNVGFKSKTAAEEPSCLTGGTTDCKLLLHGKGGYYFFEPILGTASPSTQKGNISVYIVPDGEIISVHLVRGVQ